MVETELEAETGMVRFRRCLLDWVTPIIASDQPSLESAAADTWDVLAGKPIRDGRSALPEKHRAIVDIFQEYTEVSEALEAVQDIKVYLARFPFSNTRVTRGRYLAHQVSIYLNEIYILRVRLTTLAKEVQNCLSSTPQKQITRPLIAPLFKVIKESFDGIEKTRGAHVHTRRFADDDMRRIGTLELLADHMDGASSLALVVYKNARRQWLTRIRDNEKAIDVLLDRYGDALWASLFAPGMMFDMSDAPAKPGR